MGSAFAGGLILGIESSCDETAAAVVRRGRDVLSNVVTTQIELHAPFGGVVPELASREHLRNIAPVVREAMRQARVRFDDLDAVAVTEGPGLAGALLVGILYAKALSFGTDKPLIAVNHLEGHIHAVLMQGQAGEHPDLSHGDEVLALVVSGGHTHLYLARRAATGLWSYKNIGRTVDDAAGEAYDKVAKLLGLGYPGGPWLDALAAHGDSSAVSFNFHAIKTEEQGLRFDFSFSGIKSAVLRYVQAHEMGQTIQNRRHALDVSSDMKPSEAYLLCDVQTLNLIASFQAAVVGVLMRQTFAAAHAFGLRRILVSGGVAANRELRRRFSEEALKRSSAVFFPSFALSTDNAAMIAAAAWPKLIAGSLAPEGMNAEPQLRLS